MKDVPNYVRSLLDVSGIHTDRGRECVWCALHTAESENEGRRCIENGTCDDIDDDDPPKGIVCSLNEAVQYKGDANLDSRRDDVTEIMRCVVVLVVW